MTTRSVGPDVPTTDDSSAPVRRAKDRWPPSSLDGVRRWAWVSTIVNIGIIGTGGLVRLSDSGLGCPTWPRCSSTSYVAHAALGIHGAIEFGNRLLAFVVAAVAIVTCVVAWRHKPGRLDLRVLSTLILLGIPLQAVIGGISVLTGLNPFVVAAHFLISPVIVSLSVALMRRSRTSPYPHVPRVVRDLAIALAVLTWVVLALGTMVTGSGPHAGADTSARTGFDPQVVTQLHSDAVFALFGVTVALVIATRVTPTSLTLRRLVTWTLGVEIAQAALGFTQYFLGVPIPLVLAHMLLAGILVALMTATYGERGTPLPS